MSTNHLPLISAENVKWILMDVSNSFYQRVGYATDFESLIICLDCTCQYMLLTGTYSKMRHQFSSRPADLSWKLIERPGSYLSTSLISLCWRRIGHKFLWCHIFLSSFHIFIYFCLASIFSSWNLRTGCCVKSQIQLGQQSSWWLNTGNMTPANQFFGSNSLSNATPLESPFSLSIDKMMS